MTFVEMIKKHREVVRADERGQIELEQVQCQHNDVLHWSGNTKYGPYHPERVCKECGLREKGSWGSTLEQWRSNDPIENGTLFGQARLPNKEGRTVTETKKLEEIVGLQLP